MLTRRQLLQAAAATALLPSCRDSRRPHVVVVVLDELRKDAADAWMPKLGALADQGVRFEKARSVAPWTYPSVLSMMSGLLPQQHGADGHRTNQVLGSFDPAVPTLQRRLKAAGYRTLAWVTNPFLHTWNAFHQDFDAFDISFIHSQGNLRGAAKAVWIPERMFANSVNQAALALLDRVPVDGPELLYLHYIDVHGPWKGAPFAHDYEAACRYTDARVAELYERLHARYDGNLIMVVISDHGRSRGDDETRGRGRPWRFNKSSPHDFNLRIPFWILPGRSVPSGLRVQAPVSNVDLTPTLLDWLGLAPEVALSGRSLRPLIGGGALEPVPIYARMSAFGWRNDSIVWKGRKTMRFWDPDSGAFLQAVAYDLEADPNEEKPLADPERDLARLEAEAGDRGLAWKASFDVVEDELKARLQALGYLED